MQIAVVTGNPRPQSRTRAVAHALADSIVTPFDDVVVRDIDLATVADRLFVQDDEEIVELNAQVAASDLVLVASPTYKATYTGLLKAFLDRYPTNGLADVIAVPVMTGASELHALAVESSLRPLLVKLGAGVHTRGLYFVANRMDELNQIVARWVDDHAAVLRNLLAVRRKAAGTTDARTSAAPAAAIDADRLRGVVGGFCRGITVVTGMENQRPFGMTCQSFFSLSLNPPLIVFSPQLTSTTYPHLRKTGDIVVNILAEEQHPLGRQFARSGADKFSGVAWQPAGNGAPLLSGTVAAVECTIVDEQIVGDHYLVVARATELHEAREQRPLLYFRSTFARLGAPL